MVQYIQLCHAVRYNYATLRYFTTDISQLSTAVRAVPFMTLRTFNLCARGPLLSPVPLLDHSQRLRVPFSPRILSGSHGSIWAAFGL